jgi:hypothetical protein
MNGTFNVPISEHGSRNQTVRKMCGSLRIRIATLTRPVQGVQFLPEVNSPFHRVDYVNAHE